MAVMLYGISKCQKVFVNRTSTMIFCLQRVFFHKFFKQLAKQPAFSVNVDQVPCIGLKSRTWGIIYLGPRLQVLFGLKAGVTHFQELLTHSNSILLPRKKTFHLRTPGSS